MRALGVLMAPRHGTDCREVNDSLGYERADAVEHSCCVGNVQCRRSSRAAACLDDVAACPEGAYQMRTDKSVGTSHKDLHLSGSCAAFVGPRPPSSRRVGGS